MGTVVFRGFSSIPGGIFRLAVRQAPLLISSLFISVAIAAGAYALSNYLYDRQIQEASNSIRNLSYVVSDHANRSMQAVNQSIAKVAEALLARKPTSTDALEALADSGAIRSMLDEVVVDNPFLDSAFVIAADGTVDSRSRDAMLPPEMLADKEYMNSLRRAKRGDFYLSTPFQSYRFHNWMLNFSMPVSAPDGEFLGAVAGIVKLSSFSDLFEKVNLHSNGSISLFGGDGRLLSWAPQLQMPFGASLSDTLVYRDFVQPRVDGVTREKSWVDGVERLLAVANARNFPVSVVVAMGMPDVVAAWNQQVRWLTLLAGLAIMANCAGAFQLAFRTEKHAAERERRALERQMAEQANTLANAVENIVQGLAMFDRRGGLVLYNTRYAEMYRLPLDKFKVGVTRAEMIDPRQSASQGELFERTIHEPDGSTLSHFRMRDGRIIAQRRKALADGGWVSTHEDVTAQRAAEEKIRVMATRDSLTGLLNRFALKDQLDKRLSESRRDGLKFAVFYIDLDNFKTVNDTLGHPIGDELLKTVAARISSSVRNEDVVARLGGDEFAVLQRADFVPRDPKALAERLIALISEPYVINGDHIEIGVSIGISVTPDDSDDADRLMRNADVALYHAKQDGSGAFRFFTASMDEQIRARQSQEADLKAAIAAQQFELFYQPVVSTKDRTVKSFEALIRWRHPERGFISPGEFIPLAEETGLIVPIGEWVVREACRMAATLPASVKIAVNVSTVQFNSTGFLSTVASAMDDAGVDGSRMVVEITESIMIKEAEQTIAILHDLRDFGIAIAMDDFGTGYSSLSYLRKFPFDKVKIDKSFVGGLGVDESAANIVRAAVALAGALGMVSVAEGIETEDQMSFLLEAGCEEAQGYLISKPVPARDVYALLGQNGPQISSAPPQSSRKSPPIAAPEARGLAAAARDPRMARPVQLRHVAGKRSLPPPNAAPIYVSKTLN